ncbi:hypothetical protein [Nonomuraea solani]|nr:hypothetical protein [Nonomuraea solani]
MPTRSAAVLASGTASAAKLFVAALAFTSAYVGFSAYSNASSATEPTRPVTLSARELPITVPVQETAAPVKAGEVAVTLLADGSAGCLRSYVARTTVANPDPGQSVSYGWKLTRWSPATKTWRSYLVDYAGFTGAGRPAEWRPQISGNPGWYRVELSVEGAEPVTSDRFQVSC